MTAKVAINGFGRVGRTVLRRLLDTDSELELVAVNDVADIENLAYLLEFDTTYGRLKRNVEVRDNILVVGESEIRVCQEADAKDLPWKELEIDIVLEATGLYTTADKAKAHLEAGAAKVLITAPADEKTKMIVHGVNEDNIEDDKIISSASCTTNDLAPVAKVLNDNFEIVNGYMTTVKAYTPSQSLHDGPSKDLRRGRAGAMNAIPTSTGAAKAVGKVIPALEGIVDGSAIRVPLAGGALVEFYTNLKKEVTVEEVNEAMKKASNPSFEYSDKPIVSSDVIRTSAGGIFDATLTDIVNNGDSQLVKTVSWYDSEYGFVSNLVRLTEHFADTK
ncbi:type I glyceraldehyde-3-phosphate dehydrogenase [Salinicoccus roseus]|jgi:glyceraldehyde 3-phosphate dehydrogenase|uniref:type I glyceraldehyde-3-phosphate dehydrogenase n=1 Tax=Salinicoccus roseus TaxID=45670 RepID=UPI001EF42398|nr:type I glyceraldehyde-3-phosphate dehydrogenase [Salinicoccus roseus]MCG7333526.1 type I glyceraldehyde-3-phosphate dehydrogenase [Salinicoccus roseus]